MAATITGKVNPLSNINTLFQGDLNVGRGQLGRSAFATLASGTAANFALWTEFPTRPARVFITQADTSATGSSITLPDVGTGDTQASQGHYIYIKNTTASGAGSFLVKNFGGTTIATLAAGSYRGFVANDASNWTSVDIDASSSTDLQSAYNNSSNPEIVLNTTNGGITIANTTVNSAIAMFNVANNGETADFFKVTNSAAAGMAAVITGLGNNADFSNGKIKTTAVNSLALGPDSAANVTSGYAMGDYAVATGNRGVAIGSSTQANVNCVAIGASGSGAPHAGAKAAGVADAKSITITAAASGGNYANAGVGRYFTLRTFTGNYTVYFAGLGGGTAPAVTNTTLVPVSISATETAANIATAIFTAINANPEPSAVTATNPSSGVVVFTQDYGGVITALTDVTSTVTNGGPILDANFNVNVTTGTNVDSAVAIGQAAKATADNAVAIGSDLAGTSGANASAAAAIAIGKLAAASASNALAVGFTTTASAASTVALGSTSTASATAAVAVGLSSTASAASAVAIGDTASASVASGVAVGSNANAATGAIPTALGAQTDATGDYSVAVGGYAQATAAHAVAIGGDSSASTAAVASGDSAISVGFTAVSSAVGTVALGRETDATTAGAIALGYHAQATAANAIAIGSDTTDAGSANATATEAIAIGKNSLGSAANAVAIGSSAAASNTDAVAISNTATASGAESIAIGKSTSATASNAVAIGKSITNAQAGTVAINDGTAVTLPTGTNRFVKIFSGGEVFIGGATFPGTASNSPSERKIQGTVATTNAATQATVLTVPILTNTVIGIRGCLVGARTGGTAGTAGDSWYYEFLVKAKNIAGTASAVSAVTTTLGDNTTPVLDVSASGTDFTVKVNGILDNNITWNCTVYANELTYA